MRKQDVAGIIGLLLLLLFGAAMAYTANAFGHAMAYNAPQSELNRLDNQFMASLVGFILSAGGAIIATSYFQRKERK